MSDDIAKAAVEHFPQLREATDRSLLLAKANELAQRQGYADFEHLRRDPWGRHDRLVVNPPERR